MYIFVYTGKEPTPTSPDVPETGPGKDATLLLGIYSKGPEDSSTLDDIVLQHSSSPIYFYKINNKKLAK